MFTLFLMFLMMIFSILFTQLKHPLSIGFMLLIQTFLTCLLSGSMFFSYWFSYILFLVFLGGMLVLFIYMTSLASNEMFSLSMNMLFNFIIFIMINFLIIMFMDKTIFMNFIINNEMMTFNNTNMFLKENIMNLNKLFNYPSNMMTLLLINYLFFTLVIVVKITNFFSGPLRTMF
uniref:NADH-ubiquinone oxidoreductase chain 6 n=1 Tax=Orfelia nemoralis TaxID=1588145 RepID=A0A7U3NJP1_9DIPT|nr:NADH dehydrogenase subunit 6 [Orfelia nemoralis]